MNIDRAKLITAAQRAAEAELAVAERRVAELRQKLVSTDYVAVSDYDRKDQKAAVFAQRQQWREEIRQLTQDEGGGL